MMGSIIKISVLLFAFDFAVEANYNSKGSGSGLYKPLFEKHSNSTPSFIGLTRKSVNPPVSGGSFLSRRGTSDLPIGACAPGAPCSNGACCSNTGVCSYAPTSCGPDVCISNCDAKAPCGPYAEASSAACPLKVCCSEFGFCGSTDEFCGSGCQDKYGGCGPAPKPQCEGDSTSARTIGYYESWAANRNCDKRNPEDLDLTAITHLNFAFAFFHPTTFQMMPMSAGDPELYKRFTGLKLKKQSLQCFISVGGWSFNDGTNVPNTRTAFSDMVSSAANRKTFIDSLSQFLNTYNFDGVDLDWEYPAAGDRGGVKADTSNFVTFLRELRAAFGGRYGISATIPNSYWYLQGFDVVAMQDSLDWFNLMSYDIHGVWDSTNKFTGPFIRPHTNWTEIDQGMDLLWRAGVDPSKVVLGLGWYGRSFTLSNAGCSEPNGICTFSEGGNPGECTANPGTLSNAELYRIIAAGGTQQGFDPTAAVKWITWNSSQWVSYDDGETIQMKTANGNKLCLGGVMIWAIDQDDIEGSSMNNLLGIGGANGVSAEEAANIKKQLNNADLATNIASSCYWSLCGEDCTSGYFPTTQSQGQVAGVSRDSTCSGDDVQTLCCAPGTTLGTCKWEGWRGVGLPCSPACSDPSATIIARNTNHHGSAASMDLAEDQTCNGGYQAYCCTGFVPSSKTDTRNLALYGQGGFSKRDSYALQKRGNTKGAGVGATAGLAICSALPLMALFGLFVIAMPVEFALCVAVGAAIGYIAGGMGGGTSQPNPNGSAPKPKQSKTGVAGDAKTYGQWEKVEYPATKDSSCDCAVTYTCRYDVGRGGQDFDEICDNQKWAIDKGLHGRTVYHYEGRKKKGYYYVTDWKRQRISFQKLAQTPIHNVPRCQVDEFPMGALKEALKPNPQYVRLVNGNANRRQGSDFSAWLRAVWRPCSLYRLAVCGSPTPPITWEIGNPTRGDKRTTAATTKSHFIQKYGFDSQTGDSLCYATFTYKDDKNKDQTSTISDHGFRVMVNDPLFTSYNWPMQNYKAKPENANGRPTDVNSANWLRRRAVQSVLNGDIPLTMWHTTPNNDNGQDSYDILCMNGGSLYVDIETGEISCFEDSDMVELQATENANEDLSWYRTPTVATTEDVIVISTVPQSVHVARETLPTTTPIPM